MKAKHAHDVQTFTDIPNVGPRIAHDFMRLGIHEPHTLKDEDAYALYKKLERITKTHQDPCVLDTFLAVIDFMQGAPPRPWFAYTEERKKRYGQGE